MRKSGEAEVEAISTMDHGDLLLFPVSLLHNFYYATKSKISKTESNFKIVFLQPLEQAGSENGTGKGKR